MAKTNPYVEFIIEQFEALGIITARSMFGGHTLYCNDIPFALIANSEIFLKADDKNRPEFEARGLQAFRPFEGKPGVMQYFQTPPEVFEDREALQHWGWGAVEAGRRAQAKKKTRPKKRQATN